VGTGAACYADSISVELSVSSMPVLCCVINSKLHLYIPKCCGLVVQVVLLTNISAILSKQDDSLDVLAACCTINVASAVANDMFIYCSNCVLIQARIRLLPSLESSS